MVNDTLIYCLYKSKMFVYRGESEETVQSEDQYLVNTVYKLLMTLT